MFDKYAKKKRDIRSNHKPFVNNEISQAIKPRESLKRSFFTKQKRRKSKTILQ